MIISFLLDGIYGVIVFLIGFLPIGVLSSSFSSSINSMVQYVQAYSFIFPVGTLLTVLGIALVFHLSILAFKLLHWIIGKLRGSH